MKRLLLVPAIAIVLALALAFPAFAADPVLTTGYEPAVTVTWYVPAESELAQSFTAAVGGRLAATDMYLSTSPSASGSIYAEVYEIAGVYGTTSVPTGDPLAVSAPVAANSPSGFIRFTFGGPDFFLEEGQHYALVLRDEAGNAGWGKSANAGDPAYSGNMSYKSDSGWMIPPAWNDLDFYFRVYVGGATAVDAAAPALTLPANIIAEATSRDGTVVNFTATAVDLADGAVAVSCIPASGATFPLGITTVDCTATDAAGNVARGSFTVNVVYDWSNFLQPINTDGTSVFKLGRTVPVKFAFTGASAGIANAIAKLNVTKICSSVTGDEFEAGSTSAATIGDLFRYDAISQQYIFNWGTKGLALGTYRIRVDLGDGVDRSVRVSLK